MKNAEDRDRFSLTAIVGDVLLIFNNSHDSYPLPLHFSFLFDFLRFGAFLIHSLDPTRKSEFSCIHYKTFRFWILQMKPIHLHFQSSFSTLFELTVVDYSTVSAIL